MLPLIRLAGIGSDKMPDQYDPAIVSYRSKLLANEGYNHAQKVDDRLKEISNQNKDKLTQREVDIKQQQANTAQEKMEQSKLVRPIIGKGTSPTLTGLGKEGEKNYNTVLNKIDFPNSRDIKFGKPINVMNDANELATILQKPTVTYGELQRSTQNLNLAKQETVFGNISGLLTKLTGQPSAVVPDAQRKVLLETATDIAKNARQRLSGAFDEIDKDHPEYANLPGWQAKKQKYAGGVSAPVVAPHPHDNAAIDWAKQNPQDPRAAKILKLNGM
jgi:hypothetical protein